MKKFASFLVILIILKCFSLQSFSNTNNIPFTLFVYMNGSDLESNDLYGSASTDLKEMMQIGSTKNIKIVVQTGGTLDWKTPKICNYRNQRWEIIKNDLKLVDDSLDSSSMGSPDTLSEFINWGISKYPSDRYALIFWNHGGGSVNGFGYDELNYSNPNLTLAEINTALRTSYTNTKTKFEFIGFDACLMATIEMAYILKSYTKYMIASEEFEPDTGWNYAPIIEAINNSPKMGTIDIGKTICEAFKSQAENSYLNNITMSLIDLTTVNDLVLYLNTLVKRLSNSLSSNQEINEILRARSNSEDFGNNFTTFSDMVDLGHLAENLSPNYHLESQNLLNALNRTVKYNINSSSTANAHGLSIYFPYRDKENFNTNLQKYNEVPFSKTYINFINAYIPKILDDNDLIQIKSTSNTKKYNLEVKINPDDLKKIDQIYSIMAKSDPHDPNKIIYYAIDDRIKTDADTALISCNFSQKWCKLNGTDVALYSIGDYGKYRKYAIPVKLNGKRLDIIVCFNEDNPEGIILGGWEGINGVSKMAYKGITKIVPGDVITPLFYYNNLLTHEIGFIESNKIIVNSELCLNFNELQSGDYKFGLSIKDFSQNIISSGFMDIYIPNNSYDINSNINSINNRFSAIRAGNNSKWQINSLLK